MDQLKAQCDAANTFPLNLKSDGLPSTRQSFWAKLNEHEQRLFGGIEKGELDILEFGEHSEGKAD